MKGFHSTKVPFWRAKAAFQIFETVPCFDETYFALNSVSYKWLKNGVKYFDIIVWLF